MKMETRQPSGREKDETAIQLLAQLRERLHCDNSSVARRAAFNLSWMQEDGLEILQEGLLQGRSHRTKSAAAYGLRNMHGRMKKLSISVLQEGTKDSDQMTREVCQNALELLGKSRAERIKMGRRNSGKYRIKEMRPKGKYHSKVVRNDRGRNYPTGRNSIRR